MPRWTPPSLTLKWGPYTKPDPEEQTQIIDVVTKARGAAGGEPLITRRAAVEKLKEAGIFAIENVGAFLDALEEEREEKQAEEDERADRDLEAAKAALGNQGIGTGGPGANPPSTQRPPAGDRGRSSSRKNNPRRRPGR